MKNWEILSMSVGAVALISSILLFGLPLLNFAGVALILFPPVLYLIRWVEALLQGGRLQ